MPPKEKKGRQPKQAPKTTRRFNEGKNIFSPSPGVCRNSSVFFSPKSSLRSRDRESLSSISSLSLNSDSSSDSDNIESEFQQMEKEWRTLALLFQNSQKKFVYIGNDESKDQLR